MYFWHYTQCTNFLKRSECMSSQPLYVWQHMQYIWHDIHSLWLHTIEVITLHPVHAYHHTPNIWHNTYGNTNVISAICPTISNTYLIHCICVIKPRVSVIPQRFSVWHHTLYVWHHIQYAFYHNCLGHYTPLCITSHPVYFWHHIHMNAITIPLSWKHNDYTGHLTRHIWHHSHCICVITQMAHTAVSPYRSIDDITTSV